MAYPGLSKVVKGKNIEIFATEAPVANSLTVYCTADDVVIWSKSFKLTDVAGSVIEQNHGGYVNFFRKLLPDIIAAIVKFFAGLTGAPPKPKNVAESVNQAMESFEIRETATAAEVVEKT